VGNFFIDAVVVVIIMNKLAIFYEVSIAFEKKHRKDKYIREWREFMSFKDMLVSTLIETQ
jgi:hypothetical protein